jgi:hypothetical protein
MAWVSVPDLTVHRSPQRYSFNRVIDEERSVVRFESYENDTWVMPEARSTRVVRTRSSHRKDATVPPRTARIRHAQRDAVAACLPSPASSTTGRALHTAQ